MRTMNSAQTKEINGGASKYVYCPICNYRYKTGWIERLFRSNRTVQGYLQSTHGLARNGYGRNQSQSAHR